MNIHEYQTKELFRAAGIPVPAGGVAHSPQAAANVADQIGGERFVVKAQIHAGGRGKAGGVKLCKDVEEVRAAADALLGHTLVTHQTGPAGKTIHRVLVEQASHIAREFYLGLVIDRASQRVTIIASAAGGMEIEEVARQTPERVVHEAVDPAVGLRDFQCRKIAARLGVSGPQAGQLGKILRALYRLFRDKDALMAEINPLALTAEGNLLAVDAKMGFDDNALYRHADISDLRDFDEEDPKEVAASGHGLNYIALDGDVGCIVNGAGLAMATMDVIALHGGRPANFLDVGGGASPEKVANAFRIVLQDGHVKAVLVNIFAGINRCDWIATGLVQAMQALDVKVPIVVRLAGTNVAQGREILAQSGFSFITADDLDSAAERAVAVARGA